MERSVIRDQPSPDYAALHPATSPAIVASTGRRWIGAGRSRDEPGGAEARKARSVGPLNLRQNLRQSVGHDAGCGDHRTGIAMPQALLRGAEDHRADLPVA